MTRLTDGDVRRLAKGASDHAVLEILDLGATLDDLEKALASEMGQQRFDQGGAKTILSGKAAEIQEILFEDSGGYPEERETEHPVA